MSREEGEQSDQNEEYDHVPTPAWLLKAKEDYFDPYPYKQEFREPPTDPRVKVFANPGYSRKLDAIENCIRWHIGGHHTELLIPMESSTVYGRRILEYGVERTYFDARIFPGCRNVELLTLTGSPKPRHFLERTSFYQSIRSLKRSVIPKEAWEILQPVPEAVAQAMQKEDIWEKKEP